MGLVQFRELFFLVFWGLGANVWTSKDLYATIRHGVCVITLTARRGRQTLRTPALGMTSLCTLHFIVIFCHLSNFNLTKLKSKEPMMSQVERLRVGWDKQ